MKNNILILLVGLVSFISCDTVEGQDYRYRFTITYMNDSYNFTGSQPQKTQLVNYYCEKTKVEGQKYDVYAVYSSDIWGGSEWEDDVYVKYGESPSDLSQRFPYSGSTYYIFGTKDPFKFQAVSFNSNGVRNNVVSFECGDSRLERLNTVPDDSNKENTFWNNCGTPIVSSLGVDIQRDHSKELWRVWLVDDQTYINGQNLWRRLDTQDYWVKIDTQGYIVDSFSVDCQSNGRLICSYKYTIPISSNSMTSVAGLLGFNTSNSVNLVDMGSAIGEIPPINFPDDFQNYETNISMYADGTIVSASNCNFVVPSTAQSQFVLYFESDNHILSNLGFCGGGANFYVSLASGSTNRFVTVEFCDPPYSNDGEVRIGIRIGQNGLSTAQTNILTIELGGFVMQTRITQLGN